MNNRKLPYNLLLWQTPRPCLQRWLGRISVYCKRRNSPNVVHGSHPGNMLEDRLPSFVAILARPIMGHPWLAEYAYKVERNLILEQVRKGISRYLDKELVMKQLLASFFALERLDRGNELLSTSSASELQFRLWLESAGLGVCKGCLKLLNFG